MEGQEGPQTPMCLRLLTFLPHVLPEPFVYWSVFQPGLSREPGVSPSRAEETPGFLRNRRSPGVKG